MKILFAIVIIVLITLLIYKYQISKTYDNKLLSIASNHHVKAIRNKLYSLIDSVQPKRQFKFLTPEVIIFFSFLLFLLLFLIINNIFYSKITTIVLAAPAIFLPSIILKLFCERKEKQVEDNILNFIITLKNHIQVTDNIIEAFRKVETIPEIQKHIDIFNQSISNGMDIYKAFEIMKNSIKLKKMKQLIMLLKNCVLSGGDSVELLVKYERLIREVQYEKRKRDQDTLYARIVLVIFIILDVLMLYFYVLKNPLYNQIITGSFVGQTIVAVNITTIYIMIYLILIVKKLDY